MTDITATVSPEPIYTPDAVVVINTNDVFSTINPVLMTAREISSMFRQKETLSNRNDVMNKRVANVREYLVENYDELEDHADEIARLLGFELTNEVEIEVSITVTASITIPVGSTVDDLDSGDFDVDFISQNSNIEIDSVDYSIDSIREA